MKPSMTGRTVLITGGTAGIGKAAAIGLASMGARVGITGHAISVRVTTNSDVVEMVRCHASQAVTPSSASATTAVACAETLR
jgi:NAD(P)-dependent dehydrogenase (short-subunit alcohol dehydrogenase family)